MPAKSPDAPPAPTNQGGMPGQSNGPQYVNQPRPQGINPNLGDLPQQEEHGSKDFTSI
jgi:hypothetical protein